MTIDVYCRVTAQTNSKPRPKWYSKVGALATLSAALAASGDTYRLTYVADGHLTGDLAAYVASTGILRSINAGNNRRSFLATLKVAIEQTPDDSTVVWFSEDDYYYRAEAFEVLGSVLNARLDADYFALYTPHDEEWHADHPSQPLRRVSPAPTTLIGDTSWARITHTTSTFGVRPPALRRDRRVLALSAYAGGPFAPTCGLAIQGVQPFSWRHIHRDLNINTARHEMRLSGALRPPMRALVNLLALHAQRRHRLWIAANPAFATHAESGQVADGFDWTSLVQP